MHHRVGIGAAGLILLAFGAWSNANAVPNPRVEEVSVQDFGDMTITIQIYGRFCEYQRSEVVAALQDVWSVEAMEFLTDHGTLRVRYAIGSRTREDVAHEIERALSLGWFCTARANGADAPLSDDYTLLRVAR